MTTTVVYADTTDGYVQCTSTTYSTARSGGGTMLVVTNSGAYQQVIGQHFVTPTYYVWENFFQFNTSAVGSDAVSAAVFTLTANYASNRDFSPP
jgi:hypothetical protein